MRLSAIRFAGMKASRARMKIGIGVNRRDEDAHRESSASLAPFWASDLISPRNSHTRKKREVF
jgi:hypothetical protein